MSESRMASPGELRQQITQETVSLADGPIDLYISDNLLRIVDPERDLNRTSRHRLNTRIGCFIVDPEQFDLRRETGFKALRDGERVTLGRDHTYGRFDFSDYASRAHVDIFRHGDDVVITDLDSTNGTFLVRKQPEVTPEETHLRATPTLEDDTKETAKYSSAGASIPSEKHPGLNQDAYFVDSASRALGVFDGVGGAPGPSEKAAQLAARSTAASLERISDVVPLSLASLAIREALLDAHQAILEQPEGMHIATTATIAKIFETESGASYAVIGSSGDSRAYLLRNGEIEHLTLDHAYLGGMNTAQQRDLQQTLAQATDLSRLSKAEFTAFRTRNLITSHLGGQHKTPTIALTEFEVQPGDRLLVTSDGVHDNLTDDEIKLLMRDIADDQSAANELIRAASNRSKDEQHPRAKADDMTAVILSYNV